MVRHTKGNNFKRGAVVRNRNKTFFGTSKEAINSLYKQGNTITCTLSTQDIKLKSGLSPSNNAFLVTGQLKVQLI